MESVRVVLLAGFLLLLAALIHGGIYIAGSTEGGGGAIYRVNRFTGRIIICGGGDRCFPVKVLEQRP